MTLSVGRPTVPPMHQAHPWRALRAMGDWTLHIAALPAGILGYTDHASRTIYLRAGLTQAQRRATLAHELEHARRAPFVQAVADLEEALVDQAAARDLIPLDRLVDAVRWCRSGDLGELADELWVDQDTVRTRLQHLHPAERAALQHALGGD